MRHLPSRLGTLLVLLVLACGSRGPDAKAPGAQAATSSEPAAVQPIDPDQEQGAAQPEVPEPSSKRSDSPSPDESLTPGTQRDIRFVVEEGAPRIEVDGVRFVPTASIVTVKGGWGVKVTVEATARDDRSHSWLVPKGGPLAFAGRLKRGKETTTLGDQRTGDDEVQLGSGQSQTVSRTYPSVGQPGLMPGDELELQVGLWGLGTRADNRKPVRRFLRVIASASGGKKPTVRLEPPE